MFLDSELDESLEKVLLCGSKAQEISAFIDDLPVKVKDSIRNNISINKDCHYEIDNYLVIYHFDERTKLKDLIIIKRVYNYEDRIVSCFTINNNPYFNLGEYKEVCSVSKDFNSFCGDYVPICSYQVIKNQDTVLKDSYHYGRLEKDGVFFDGIKKTHYSNCDYSEDYTDIGSLVLKK